MTGYNGLSRIKVDHLEAGICPEHGYLLTSEQCNCYPEQTALFFAVEQTKSQDWQADADKLHALLNPLNEVKTQYRCENCQQGERPPHLYTDGYQTCLCCNGNWRDCSNCHPEGCGNDTADLLASMR